MDRSVPCRYNEAGRADTTSMNQSKKSPWMSPTGGPKCLTCPTVAVLIAPSNKCALGQKESEKGIQIKGILCVW